MLGSVHLLAGGRHRFGHITGPPRFLAARLRARGVSDTLRLIGCRVPEAIALAGSATGARRCLALIPL